MDITKLTWCPDNVTYSKTWMNYGISTCTMEIIGAMMVLVYTIFFGTYHLWKHKEHKVTSDCYKRANNGIHVLQLFLLLILPVLSLSNFALQAKEIYGYMVSR